MPVVNRDNPTSDRVANGIAIIDKILDHRSEIIATAHVAWSVFAAKKAIKVAGEGKTGKSVAWGLYAGYATISSALNVGAAVVEHTSDSPQDHPIVKARNAINPDFKKKEPETPVANLRML